MLQDFGDSDEEAQEDIAKEVPTSADLEPDPPSNLLMNAAKGLILHHYHLVIYVESCQRTPSVLSIVLVLNTKYLTTKNTTVFRLL
jgi:hypothetical protein